MVKGGRGGGTLVRMSGFYFTVASRRLYWGVGSYLVLTLDLAFFFSLSAWKKCGPEMEGMSFPTLFIA